MIKHPVTKNSAKEEPQNYIKKNIFHTFKNLLYNSVLLKYLMLMFYSDVDKSVIQQCNAALSSFYISVLLNRILNQTTSVKSCYCNSK